MTTKKKNPIKKGILINKYTFLQKWFTMNTDTDTDTDTDSNKSHNIDENYTKKRHAIWSSP
jgi:hypothetical protein